MSGPENFKTSKPLIRICRQNDDAPILEYGWELVRIEPESGNAVAERDNKRIVCLKKEFEICNFPGSDTVWEIIDKEPEDEDIACAKKSWAKLDLGGTISALIRHTRKADPTLADIQTIDDLRKKIENAESACFRSMDILRMELKRAKNEYDRCPNNTLFMGDQKDSLLARWRDLEDKYNTRRYQYEKIIPYWHRLLTALASLDKTFKNTK